MSFLKSETLCIYFYLFKGYLLALPLIVGQYQMIIFGLIFPYISQAYFDLPLESEEYHKFYSLCFILFTLFAGIGSFIGGSLIFRRSRFLVFLFLDLTGILVLSCHLIPSLYALVALRGLMGLQAGVMGSAMVVWISEMNLVQISGTFMNIYSVNLFLGGLISTGLGFFRLETRSLAGFWSSAFAFCCCFCTFSSFWPSEAKILLDFR